MGPDAAGEPGGAKGRPGLGGRLGHHRRRRGRAGPSPGGRCVRAPGCGVAPGSGADSPGSRGGERGRRRPVRRGRRARGAASNFACPGNCGRPRGRLVWAERNRRETWALRTDLTLQGRLVARGSGCLHRGAEPSVVAPGLFPRRPLPCFGTFNCFGLGFCY